MDESEDARENCAAGHRAWLTGEICLGLNIAAAKAFARCSLAVQAVPHVKRMRGGAQSHLMRADDGNFYVVKFHNNPPHRRVPAHDLFATRLARYVALPVPVVEVIEVDGWLVEHTSELTLDRKDEVVAFGWETMERAGMVIEPVSRVPEFAKQARMALRA